MKNVESITYENQYKETKVFERIVDHENRIIHIMDAFGPDYHEDYNHYYLSNEFLNYWRKVFDGKYINRFEISYIYDNQLKTKIDLMGRFLKKDDYTTEKVDDIRFDYWLLTWSWCFYSGGSNIHIYEKGIMHTARYNMLEKLPSYLSEKLDMRFLQKAHDIQDSYRRR